MAKKTILTRQGLSEGIDMQIKAYMKEKGISDYTQAYREYSQKYPNVIQAWGQAPAMDRKLSVEIEK